MNEGNAERPRLILASGSPRRRQLLEGAGLSFEIRESGLAEELGRGETAAEFAVRMAREKAAVVSAREVDALVIAADTIVECEGVILGKPDDAAAARRMLEMLSGRTHTVVTAFALARAGCVLEAEPVRSRVSFRRIEAREIEAYIATGEPLDKAGAYGIQGMGGEFIDHVEGSRDNVMGLPVAEVIAALERHGIRAKTRDREQ